MPLSIEMYATEERKEVVEAAKATTGQFSVDSYVAANTTKYETLKADMAAKEARLKVVEDYSTRMDAAIKAKNAAEVEKLKAEYTGLYTEVATSLKTFYGDTLVYVKNPTDGTVDVYAKQVTPEKTEYISLGNATVAEQITYTALITKLDADMGQEMLTLMNTLKEEEGELAAQLKEAAVPGATDTMDFGQRMSLARKSITNGDLDGAMNAITPAFAGIFGGIAGLATGFAASSNETMKQIGNFFKGILGHAGEMLSSIGINIPGLDKFKLAEAVKVGPIVYPEGLQSDKTLELTIDNFVVGKVKQGTTPAQLAEITGIPTYAALLDKYKKYSEGSSKGPKDFFALMNESMAAVGGSALLQPKVAGESQYRAGVLAILGYSTNYGKEQARGVGNVFEMKTATDWPGATQEVDENGQKSVYRAYPEGGHIQCMAEYLTYLSARAASASPAWTTSEAMITGMYPGDQHKATREQLMKIIKDNGLAALDKPVSV